MHSQWRVLVAETLTGDIIADIVPRDLPAFTRAITDKGAWTVNVIPHDRHNQHLDLHALTDVGRYSWVVAYGNYICQAGPVTTYQYDENTHNLSVSGTGLQGLFARRVVRNVNGGNTAITHTSQDLSYTNLTLASVARNLVEENMKQEFYELPLDLPAVQTGTNERTYQGYDLATVWDRLEELADVIDGPEIDFWPAFQGLQNKVRWHMITGNPLLGDQESAAVWDYGGALTAIDVDVNGSASPCMRVWSKGSGSEREMKVGFYKDHTLTALGFPPTDYVDSEHTSATTVAVLDGHARIAQQEFAYPVETWTCSVRIDNGQDLSPSLGSWQLGDAPQYGVSGHPWLADGMYRRRILGFSNDTESQVKLDLKPGAEVI